MAIIGISAKIGGGKDTVGSIIQYLVCLDKNVLAEHQKNFSEFSRAPFSNQKQSGWEIRKFAFKLKQITALLTGCTVEELEDQDFKKRELPREWWYILGYKDNEIYPMYATSRVLNELGEDRIHKYTYREMLQKIGTEAMRNSIHENVWVNALFADYKGEFNQYHEDDLSHRAFPNWIITDMRFPNELEAVKNNDGITIRINRPVVPIIRGGVTTTPYGNGKFIITKDSWTLNNVPIPEECIGQIIDHPNGEFNWVESPAISSHPSEIALDNAEFDYVIDNNGTIDELIDKVREILQKEKIIS
jgi:hypothetical protein